MPLYDVKCGTCGHQFEALVRSHSTELICPECSGHTCQRLVGRVSFILQGTGWARDGYGDGRPGGQEDGSSG